MSLPDFAAYRDPATGPLAFCGEQIVLPNRLRLADAIGADPWIVRDLLRPVFDCDEAGLPLHRLCYLEFPRGHWKSGGAGAIAITEAVLHASTDIVIAAADLDQARIIGQNISGFLGRNRALRGSFRRRGDEWEVPARGSRIRIIASDAESAWGHGGTHARFRVICDELTAWRSDALWVALASATGKVADAQTIVLSNAGFDADRSWQWKVRETADREAWGYLFSAPGSIASWISEEWIEQMRSLLPGAAFDRVVLNVWTSVSGDFVTAEQWRRCVDRRRPSVTGTASTHFGGIDLGLTKDRTALAIVHLDSQQNVVLDELLVWQGSRAEPVNVATIERAILDVHRRYPGLRLLCDPWQFKSSVQRLRSEGVSVEEYHFSATSISRLSAVLYEIISDATLRVFQDADLDREILGLQVIQGASGWKLDHRVGGYSDRAVALGMACMGAVARRGQGVVTISVPSGQIRAPRFLRDEDDLSLPFPEAQATSEFARERLAAMRARAGVPATTRWRPDLRR